MKNRILFIVIMLSCFLFGLCNKAPGVQIDWDTYPVYQWKDYLNIKKYSFRENTELNIKFAVFPDVEFVWEKFSISAYKNGEKQVLSEGILLNAFFTDLNHDNFPELCTTVGGFCNCHIIVYDYRNQKQYFLWDKIQYDYQLYLEKDVLLVKKSSCFSKDSDEPDAIQGGRLAIENDILSFEQV